jgi:chaperonin GroEL (HSP60 family)
MPDTDSENRKSGAEVPDRMSALLSNAGAIRTVAAAIEGTLGPKGLDCMLVDRFGDVTVTNDGSAILDKIEVSHPAARMLVSTAKAQDREVGDGTTTAAILASALVTEGVSQVAKGVPVTKVIEGMRSGLDCAIAAMQSRSLPIADFDDPRLMQAAVIAGRGEREIAALAVEAAALVGRATLAEPDFRLSDWIVAREGAQSDVFPGIVIEKERINRQMPCVVRRARILLVDDALEPEALEDEALATEAGFARYLELKGRFSEALTRIIALGANVVVVERGVSDEAEAALTEGGVMALRRVSTRDLGRIAEHTGARPLKRTGLQRAPDEIEPCLGRAKLVAEDERLGHVRFEGGRGRRVATMVIGAATAEIREERQRIAEDAASAVQQALRGGVLPGGGAAEMAASLEVQRLRESTAGMAAYGADCVVEALKRPLAQIVANAGFNPLEKLGNLVAEKARDQGHALAIDCDTGSVADMLTLGVVDSTTVKVHALRAAGEVAEAVLRINTIIRRRDSGPRPAGESGG